MAGGGTCDGQSEIQCSDVKRVKAKGDGAIQSTKHGQSENSVDGDVMGRVRFRAVM
jgi:hypothetical protein